MRNKPNTETQLAELQEKYSDMEELLKAKCVEVEATDDKYLESVLLCIRSLVCLNIVFSAGSFKKGGSSTQDSTTSIEKFTS
jgi:hypothetical protein